MDSKLFVPAKMTFPQYVRCLKFPAIGYFVLQKQNKFRRAISFVISYPPRAANLKHLKFSENVNFEETNSVVSILVSYVKSGCSQYDYSK